MSDSPLLTSPARGEELLLGSNEFALEFLLLALLLYLKSVIIENYERD
jgi:hypothetical protein